MNRVTCILHCDSLASQTNFQVLITESIAVSLFPICFSKFEHSLWNWTTEPGCTATEIFISPLLPRGFLLARDTDIEITSRNHERICNGSNRFTVESVKTKISTGRNSNLRFTFNFSTRDALESKQTFEICKLDRGNARSSSVSTNSCSFVENANLHKYSTVVAVLRFSNFLFLFLFSNNLLTEPLLGNIYWYYPVGDEVGFQWRNSARGKISKTEISGSWNEKWN